ncbi:MAG TPA: TIGR03435 family protein [Planctomycetaceae bacterium]|nr:TIGR03435 family protein [Planctomycetaceae bacterium]
MKYQKIALLAAFSAVAAFAQTAKLSFEAATIRPAAPIDMAKMAAAMQAGGKLPVGANVGATQAEYLYLDLKSLISFAYNVKPFQVTGPDWLANTRFDIIAKYPAGATKADASKMLQSLLEDRFKLTFHRTSEEHPVLALVPGKGGIKLRESTETPKAIDESVPAPPGTMTTQGPDGPIRMSVKPGSGAVVDMGEKGKMTYTLNPATKAIHVDLSMVTIPGLADMLTQMMQQFSGGMGGGRQIVDMTGIKGHYEASLEISLADMMAMARNAGMDIPGAPGGGSGAGPGSAVASDPAGGAQTVTEAIQSMGLKLESRKAPIEQLVVDHIEKAPTEN